MSDMIAPRWFTGAKAAMSELIVGIVNAMATPCMIAGTRRTQRLGTRRDERHGDSVQHEAGGEEPFLREPPGEPAEL